MEATETRDAIIAAVMAVNGGTEVATTAVVMTAMTEGMTVNGEAVVAVVMTAGNVKRLTVAVSLVEMNPLQVCCM